MNNRYLRNSIVSVNKNAVLIFLTIISFFTLLMAFNKSSNDENLKSDLTIQFMDE